MSKETQRNKLGENCSCDFLSQRHKNGRLNKGAIDAAMEYFPFKRS